MDASAEESPYGEHDARSLECNARNGYHAANLLPLDEEVRCLLLEEHQVGLILQQGADGLAIKLAIGLRPGGADGGAFAGVQGAKLNTGSIGGAGHGAPQSIDFPDEVTLPNTADGRIAAHLAERLDALRHQESTRTHARGRQSGFSAGVTATDDDDVKGLRETHDWWSCCVRDADRVRARYCRAAAPANKTIRAQIRPAVQPSQAG
jgi:hypothetical protein